jgi:hypothetical protein
MDQRLSQSSGLNPINKLDYSPKRIKFSSRGMKPTEIEIELGLILLFYQAVFNGSDTAVKIENDEI